MSSVNADFKRAVDLHAILAETASSRSKPADADKKVVKVSSKKYAKSMKDLHELLGANVSDKVLSELLAKYDMDVNAAANAYLEGAYVDEDAGWEDVISRQKKKDEYKKETETLPRERHERPPCKFVASENKPVAAPVSSESSSQIASTSSLSSSSSVPQPAAAPTMRDSTRARQSRYQNQSYAEKPKAKVEESVAAQAAQAAPPAPSKPTWASLFKVEERKPAVSSAAPVTKSLPRKEPRPQHHKEKRDESHQREETTTVAETPVSSPDSGVAAVSAAPIVAEVPIPISVPAPALAPAPAPVPQPEPTAVPHPTVTSAPAALREEPLIPHEAVQIPGLSEIPDLQFQFGTFGIDVSKKTEHSVAAAAPIDVAESKPIEKQTPQTVSQVVQQQSAPAQAPQQADTTYGYSGYQMQNSGFTEEQQQHLASQQSAQAQQAQAQQQPYAQQGVSSVGGNHPQAVPMSMYPAAYYHPSFYPPYYPQQYQYMMPHHPGAAPVPFGAAGASQTGATGVAAGAAASQNKDAKSQQAGVPQQVPVPMYYGYDYDYYQQPQYFMPMVDGSMNAAGAKGSVKGHHHGHHGHHGHQHHDYQNYYPNSMQGSAAGMQGSKNSMGVIPSNDYYGSSAQGQPQQTPQYHAHHSHHNMGGYQQSGTQRGYGQHGQGWNQSS
eukprot:ANDGO_01369.mRNA.1 hypothetical protein